MTADHGSFRDDVAVYALGALSEAEAADLQRHMHSCAECTSELERFRSVVEALPMTVAPQTPHAELKRDVTERIRVAESLEPPRASPRELFGGVPTRRLALAGAGVFVSLALVAGGYVLGSSSVDSGNTLRAAVDRTRAPDVCAVLARQGDIGVLRISKLPPVQGGVYVLWIDRGAGPVFASSVNSVSSAKAEVGVTGLDRVKRMTVTREATLGVASPTTRPVLTVSLR